MQVVPIVLGDRQDLTLEVFEQVAWQGRSIALHERALARMAECREQFMRLLDHDPDLVVYGVTTGYGAKASVRLSPEELRQHARGIFLGPATSFGEPLPERVVRGIVLARFANYLEGHSAVTPALAQAVVAMLDGRPLPPVPALGNGGAGEIQPLATLFAALIESFPLAEKEMLCLVNGSPCASALLADAVLAARRRLALAMAVFALSIEALKAPLEPYDAALESLWGDPHEALVLRELRAWGEGGAAERRPYQAPVSWRILPRVLGQAARALAQAEDVAATSLRAVTDNPVYVPPDDVHPFGRVLSTGGYHNAAAYPALDQLAAIWAELALLCDRHVTKLLDGNVSLLPPQLLPTDGGGAADGTFLGCLGMTAVAYAEQARHAAERTLLPGSEGGGFGQNDVAVPTFPSWRREGEAGRCLDANLALLGAVASQALYVTDRAAPPALTPLLEEIRGLFPPVLSSRQLGPDAERLTQSFTAKVFAGAPITPA